MYDQNKKQTLQRNTQAYVAWIIFRAKLSTACENRRVVLVLVTCFFCAMAMHMHVVSNPHSIALAKVLSIISIWGFWGVSFIATILVYGHFPSALKMANGFIRSGCVNHAGEPPLLIHKKIVSPEEFEYTFFCRGLSLDDWIVLKPKIESALNIIILRFIEGENKQYITVRCVNGNIMLPTVVEWPGLSEGNKDTEILIGQGYVGPVTIDLAKIPHWLVGGSTGCGKSRLLAGMIFQMLIQGYAVFLIDAKDGMDYGFVRPYAIILKETGEIVTLLENLMDAMNDRRESLKRAEVHDIGEYNDKYPQYHMRRICLVIDEAAFVFDAKAGTKEEKEAIGKITRYVTQIGRLARFAGLHLIVATQRPDVNSVPGPVKANLAGRIAGHCADDQASITILDDGSATEIPAIPGRFIVRDGGLDNNIVQAYLLDENKISAEIKKYVGGPRE